MPFVTAGDGTELLYETEGQGFPLVFTHGNMSFGQQFFLQTRVFRCHYRCVLHDSRGCGLSGKPADEIYDTKTQAADLRAILRAAGVEKAVHVGHSFGGPIALQYYFDHPNVGRRAHLYRFVLGGSATGDHGRAGALPIRHYSR